jgi:hypothetical protein
MFPEYMTPVNPIREIRRFHQQSYHPNLHYRANQGVPRCGNGYPHQSRSPASPDTILNLRQRRDRLRRIVATPTARTVAMETTIATPCALISLVS